MFVLVRHVVSVLSAS